MSKKKQVARFKIFLLILLFFPFFVGASNDVLDVATNCSTNDNSCGDQTIGSNEEDNGSAANLSTTGGNMNPSEPTTTVQSQAADGETITEVFDDGGDTISLPLPEEGPPSLSGVNPLPVSGILANINYIGGGAGYVVNTDKGFYLIVASLITTALSIVGVAFLILMIYGGFLWMTDRGNEAQAKKAINLIQAAVIGLIIVISAYAITYFVVQTFGQGQLATMSSPTGQAKK